MRLLTIQLSSALYTVLAIYYNQSDQNLRRLQSNGGPLCPGSKGEQSYGFKQISGSNKPGSTSPTSSSVRYFYMMVDAESPTDATPSFLLLPGGPGGSSVSGVLSIMGPCFLNTDNKTPLLNHNSWTKNARGIFIDAPGPVGFSEGPIPTTMSDYVDHLYEMLLSVVTDKPKFGRNLHLLGISFDSVTVSLLASKILANKPANIDFKGIIVVDGVTGTIDRYSGCLTMAKKLVDKATFKEMESSLPTCDEDIKACQPSRPGGDPNPAECQEAANTCAWNFMHPLLEKDISIYDIRVKTGQESKYWQIKTGDVEKFFNDPNIQAALKVKKQWSKVNEDVHKSLTKFSMVDISYGIQQTLDAGLKVLFIAGDRDYTTNFPGLFNWMTKVNGRFPYGEKVTQAKEKTLQFPQGGKVGTIRSKVFSNNAKLALVKVIGGSHSPASNNVAGLQNTFDAYLSGSIYQ